jgi:hypothetical protein|tara:strand:- start:633 stop:860 length:228 start_codon:yes stop_codon:yes gene_type:complete
MDWIDEILASEPISNAQIAVIEGLLTSVPYEQEDIRDIENGLLHLTYEEAYELINKLKEDYIPKDPREQFNKIFK